MPEPVTATTADAPSKPRPRAIDVSFASYVEFESVAKGWTKRIENPLWVFQPEGAGRYHVVDKDGKTTPLPSESVFFTYGQPTGTDLSDPNKIHLLL